MKKKINKTLLLLHTDGKGSWTEKSKEVRIIDMRLIFDRDNPGYAELRLYFNPEKWNVNKDGLIYTDKLFLKELQTHFNKLYGSKNVSYSEQGMQDFNYVSLDVEEDIVYKFLADFYLEHNQPL